MDFRHEWKHEITAMDRLCLRSRLGAVMQADAHAQNGQYTIRSLYFDTPEDKALQEKLMGVSRREKFRIRLYNGDTSVIHLEKKIRSAGLGTKITASLTAAEVQALLDGELDWMKEHPQPLVRELYAKMISERLMPRTIVEYTREPFVYGPGNVRVTLDYDIRTSMEVGGFLKRDCPTIPAGDAPILLEVKWDEFLPDVIRDIVQLPHCQTGAFSKYAQCRIYG